VKSIVGIMAVILMLSDINSIDAQTSEPINLSYLYECIYKGDYWRLKECAENSPPQNLDTQSGAILGSFSAHLMGENQTAISLIQPLSNSSNEPAYTCLQARYLAAQGNLKEAIAVLTQKLDVCNHPCLWINLAAIFVSNHQLNEAVAAATKGIASESACADAYYFRGFALWKKGEPNSAVDDFEKAMSIRPSGPFRNESNPHLLCGIFYSKSGKIEKSLIILNFALDNLPHSHHIATLLWQLYCESNQHFKALAVAEKSLKSDPMSSESSGLYVMSLINLNRLIEGEEWVNKWLERSPNDARANILMAQIRIYQGQFQDAFALAEKSKQYAPLDFEARSNFIRIGLHLFNSDQLENSSQNKTEIAEELCSISKQLCEETNWKIEKYVELMIAVYKACGRADEISQIPKMQLRIANQEREDNAVR
jgi:tetratricopeptide (TPR) repeat protein